MTLKPWKTISTEEIGKNPWWRYIVDKFQLPDGNEGVYHYVSTPGSVIIVPLQYDGSILAVKQYRYLDSNVSLEFPTGGMKDGEDPERIAHKELIEETGFDGELEKIGAFNPCKGIIRETAHVFIARNLVPSAASVKDDTEEFEHVSLSINELEKKIGNNEINDGMTMAAWAMVKCRLNK